MAQASRRPFSPSDRDACQFSMEMASDKDVVAPRPQRVPNADGTEAAPEVTRTEVRNSLLQQLEEEAVRNPDAWETPSPTPDANIERMYGGNEHLMPFSPPTRAHNPMIQNSPFQGSPFSPSTKAVQLKDSKEENNDSTKVTSPREAGLRRRRLRSLSCPEPDSNLVVGEA